MKAGGFWRNSRCSNSISAWKRAATSRAPKSSPIRSESERYRIDLHPSTGGRNYIDIPSWPYQIPLGALIPQRVENLLPACKNLGVTHLTNGCYRLHPTEWNIGESAGALAAYCLEQRLTPRQVRSTAEFLDEFQRLLSRDLGIMLAWPEEIRLTPRDKANPLGF